MFFEVNLYLTALRYFNEFSHYISLFENKNESINYDAYGQF